MKLILEGVVDVLKESYGIVSEAEDAPKKGDRVGYPSHGKLIKGTLSKYDPDRDRFEITWDEEENMAKPWFIGILSIVSFHRDKFVKGLKPGQRYFNISK
uniref:Uncharacterized protein n=2 Tax=unclassified Caudoviricetes TaxID=2788787 RepID=A0AAU8HY63_9CAUD